MRGLLPHGLLFLAGVPALGCQVVWVQMFAAGLGHELPAALAVVSACFVALAAGAWALDAPLSRTRRPAAWFAGLQIFHALWIAATSRWIAPANDLALRLLGSEPDPAWHGLVALAVPLLLIGPPAAAMGAALPAAERWRAQAGPGGTRVAGLYAANTAGGVAGVALAVGLLMPALGLSGALLALAAVSAAGGLVAAGAARRRATIGAPKGEERGPALPPAGILIGRLGTTLFVTGLLGIGFELLALRVMAQVTENTVYSFAGALAVYLAGTAGGAAWLQARQARGATGPETGTLLVALALACLAATAVLATGPILLGWLRRMSGSGAGAGMAAEMLLAAAVLLGPTLVMGALFGTLAERARGPNGGLGRAVAVNTLGAALAGPVFVVGLLPALGARWTLTLVALAYLLLVPRVRGRHAAGMALAGVAALALPGLRLIEVPPGAEVVFHREGVLGSVAVVRTPDGHRTLRVNNHFQMGGTGTAAAAQRHAVPLLLHPAPRRVLFLGAGTGLTMSGAVGFEGLSAEGVELVPEVVAAMPWFAPENEEVWRRPGFRVVTADARRFVRTTTNRYDVIVADLFHPAQDGAAFLFTREHFAALRARLAPGGLVCQWLPLHQLGKRDLGSVVGAFLSVFPDATGWWLRFNAEVPVFGLMAVAPMGGPGSTPAHFDPGSAAVESRPPGGPSNLSSGPPARFDPAQIQQALDRPGLEDRLRRLGLGDPVRVLGHLAAGKGGLRALVRGAPVNLDDRPVVLFAAPHRAHRQSGDAYGPLLEVVRAGPPPFAELVALPAGAEGANLGRRLADFAAARDAYLRGLVLEGEGRPAEALEAHLASAGVSRDFTAGYAQAVLIAGAFAREDPAGARAILERLVAVQPEQRLARDLLERLGGN